MYLPKGQIPTDLRIVKLGFLQCAPKCSGIGGTWLDSLNCLENPLKPSYIPSGFGAIRISALGLRGA